MSQEDANEQQKRILWKRRRLRSDFQEVFSSPAGKRVMRELYKQSVEVNAGYIQRETALHMQGRRWLYVLICKNQRITDAEIVHFTTDE